MEDDALGVGGPLDDDGGSPHLASRAGGGGHGDDRGHPCHVDAGPVVPDVFKVPQRTVLAHHQGHTFGHVQGRATTKGDDPVVCPFPIGADSVLDVSAVRVPVHPGEDTSAGQLRRILGDVQVRQAAVRHQQWIGDAQLSADGRQFDDSSGAEAHGGGVVPVSLHQVRTLRWKDLGRVRRS